MAKVPKQKEEPSDFEIMQAQIVALQAQVMFLESQVSRADTGTVDRLKSVEDAAEQQLPDAPFAEVADPPGEPPDVKVWTNAGDGLSEGEMLPFEIEQGVPKADVTADSDVVVLRPCDPLGVEYDDAADFTAYVCDDRSEQVLINKGWVATAGATIGTIISFIRTPVFGPDADGILFGEALAELPAFPEADGTYWLKLVMDTDVPTLTWGTTTDAWP